MQTFRIQLDSKKRIKGAPDLFVDVKADDEKQALNILRSAIRVGVPTIRAKGPLSLGGVRES